MNTKECISDADIGRLLEGDVTEQHRQTLQRHIEVCPDCKARWQQLSAGAQYVESMFKADQSNCLSEDLLTGFIDKTLNPEKRHTVEEHLAQCSRCRDSLAERVADSYTRQGDKWWSEYVGCQILSLFAKIPEEINGLLEILKITVSESAVQTSQTIKLPILEPTEEQTMRLAAATGEGLFEQRLHQDNPPFDFHLVQFGQQLRIEIREAGEEPDYQNCLGRLEWFEADSLKYSQVVLIDKGQGRCTIQPEDVGRLHPKEHGLAIRLVPIITLADLTSMKTEAYRPILARLLRHAEPGIRKSVVEVVVRIYGPQARVLIEPLAEDEDEAVRLAVKMALQRLPAP